MSREIKFRAWDIKEKRWAAHRIMPVLKGLIERLTLKDCLPISGRLIIEQYTGLKDRHGTEIYEGDVVLDYYDGDDAFIVKWDEDTASFILTGTDNIAAVSFDNFFPNEDLEIIGNIHENPELLGGEDE